MPSHSVRAKLETTKAAWPKNAVANEGPQVERVSLLVPARNAARTLTALLQDLHAQQWPKEALEVIVVDDGSEDGTAEQRNGPVRAQQTAMFPKTPSHLTVPW